MSFTRRENKRVIRRIKGAGQGTDNPLVDQATPIPPPSPDKDEAAARRLGITLEQYRSLQRSFQCDDVEALVEEARRRGSTSMTEEEGNGDVQNEEAAYQHLRRTGSFFRSRGQSPGLLETASKTPGQIATMILTCAYWLVLLVLTAPYYQSWGFREALSLIPFFGSAILAWSAAEATWRKIGPERRERVRIAIRFWPVTLVVLIFTLGLLRLAFGR